MMRTWVTFVATVTLCVATSAFSAERTPGWVNGTAEFFPNELYIVGVGSGDERADAETRAYCQQHHVPVYESLHAFVIATLASD